MKYRLTLSLVALAGITLGAEETKTQLPPTSPTSGKEMYRAYCASCHGANGKGDGPVAPALKHTLPDLTQLTQKNGGKFPELHVTQIIEGNSAFPAHGSREMPVWGLSFRQMGGSDEARVRLRIRNLTRFLEGIQIPPAKSAP